MEIYLKFFNGRMDMGMDQIAIFNFRFSTWILIPLVYFVWVTFLLFFKTICFKAIKKVAQKTKTQLDDIFVKAADFPLVLLIFTSGGVIIERMLPVATEAQLTTYFLVGFKAVTIVAIILFIDKFLNGLIHGYSAKVDILRSSGGIA
ncbi:hypothetical protein MNBD_BACTEROID05-509, partial [hydrothermal vent metagenome]